jgi:hypothetical protein
MMATELINLDWLVQVLPLAGLVVTVLCGVAGCFVLTRPK